MMTRFLFAFMIFLAFPAQAEGFRAHLGGQSLVGGWWANAYTHLEMPVVAHGDSANYTNGCWTAPADGEVMFGLQVWISAGATGNPPNYAARIVKNDLWDNDDDLAGLGSPTGFLNSVKIPLAAATWADFGDQFCLYLFTTNTWAVVDGNPAHTWWSAIQP